MIKQAVQPLSVIATVLAIAGFTFTYVTGSTLSAALAIMAWIYYFGTAILLAWTVVAEKGIRERASGAAICVGVLAAIVFMSHRFTDFIPDGFGGLQIIGAIFFCTIAGIASIALVESYRDNHKICPECVNTVNAKARVCEYCGYRWEPPLEGKDRPNQFRQRRRLTDG
jgi:hypothetical protein